MTAEETTSVDRRDAMKKGATAAAVVGVAWAAPRIEGMSIVPDYANAQSVPSDGPGPIIFDFEFFTEIGASPLSPLFIPVGPDAGSMMFGLVGRIDVGLAGLLPPLDPPLPIPSTALALTSFVPDIAGPDLAGPSLSPGCTFTDLTFNLIAPPLSDPGVSGIIPIIPFGLGHAAGAYLPPDVFPGSPQFGNGGAFGGSGSISCV